MSDMEEMRCESCGQFMRPAQSGSSWADHFSFHPPGLDETLLRCRVCTERKGPVRTNARGCVSSYEGVRA